MHATTAITVWFTGLPCSGKTTLASALYLKLSAQRRVFHVDGDDLRKGLNSDLSFTEADRRENVRRAAHLSVLLMSSHEVVLASFVSPMASDRRLAREIIGDRFVEVFVDCPLEVCERRDVKGMYRKARSGELKNFTGIQARYETPVAPEIVIETGTQAVERSLAELEARLTPFLPLHE
jgi:adenylyl-sulfate kinase